MEIMLLWLVLAVVVGIVAGARGRNGFGYFLLSIVLSPLIGLILAIALPNRLPQIERQRELALSKKCPHCAEMVKLEAKVCRFCGHELQPSPELQLQEKPQPRGLSIVGSMVIALVALAVLAMLVGGSSR